jgi:hypothetical protein
VSERVVRSRLLRVMNALHRRTLARNDFGLVARRRNRTAHVESYLDDDDDDDVHDEDNDDDDDDDDNDDEFDESPHDDINGDATRTRIDANVRRARAIARECEIVDASVPVVADDVDDATTLGECSGESEVDDDM